MKFWTRFERRNQKLAPLSVFVRRMLHATGFAVAVIVIVLLIGICGYHWLGELDWVDSLLEASMILGGMGPVNPIKTTGAKLFASGYALFSGLVFIGIMGILLTPVVHRMMHKFHVD
ncbi:MAG TPA: hypothetical protein VIW64_14100 [Pyrinomonadaceae bacterium]|jgi:hypothetical protein